MADDQLEWDLEKVYDEQIAPLMKQVVVICKEHKLPMLASFQFTDEQLCTTSLPFKERGEFRFKRAYDDIYRPASFVAMTIHTVKEPTNG